jgi:REP element-mobilizing transposase RayT
MAHTHTLNLIHMVFATKDRAPIITPSFKPRLHAYMAGIVRGLDAYLYALDGVADHCHLVFDLPAKISLADFANTLKSRATKWARREGGQPKFGWQRGYGAFSMNRASLDNAIRYVKDQEEHHRHKTLREELAEFLRVHGMQADSEFIDGVFDPDDA